MPSDPHAAGTPAYEAPEDEFEVSIEEPVEVPLQEAEACEREAASASPAGAARLLVHAARLRSRAGQFAEGLALLRRARELAPEHRPALEIERRLCAAAGDWEAVQRLYDEELRFVRDPRGQAEVLRARAAVLSRRLGRFEDADECLYRALELLPEHPALLEGAIAAATRTGDIGQALALHRRAAAALKDDRLKARHLRRAIALSQDPALTAELHEALLAVAPTDLAAQAAALPGVRAKNDLARLEAVAREELHDWSGPDTRRQLAELLAPQGGEALEDAKELLETARDLDPRAGRSLDALAVFAESTADHELLLSTLGARADSARDPRDQAVALLRLARLHEAAGRTDEALDRYKAVLAALPSHPEAVGAMQRLGADPAATLDVAHEAARTSLSAGDQEASSQALRRIVEAEPAHPTAWAELARVEERLGRWTPAAQAWERHAALLEEPRAKGDAWLRVAELRDGRLGDATGAATASENAVAANPKLSSGWRLIARLAVARGDDARAIAALERELDSSDPRLRTSATLQLAVWLGQKPDGAARAIALLEKLLEDEPSEGLAIAELERLLTESGDTARAAELRSKVAARCSDPAAAAALRTSAAEARMSLGDEDGAVAEWRRALAVDPRARTVVDELALALENKGDRATLADLLQRTMPWYDPETQALFHLLRGELLEAEGQAAPALRAYRDAAASDPLLLPALRHARRLHEAAGEWSEARSLLAEEGEAHPDPTIGVELVVRAGALAERLREEETAEAHYLRALEKRPAHPKALERLAALWTPQKRFPELVTIYEREGELVSAEPLQSARLYAEAAWLRYEALDEDRRAAVPMNRALSRDPSCARALELKAVFAGADGRWPEAVEALEKALATASGTRLYERLARAKLAAGDVEGALSAVERLEAPEDAKTARLAASVKAAAGDVMGASVLFQRALTLEPGDREAVEGLEAVHEAAGDAAGLVRAWEALSAVSPADPTVRLHLARAHGRAGAEAKALESLRTLLAEDPFSPEPWRALAGLHAKADRTDALFVALSGLEAVGGADEGERAMRSNLAAKLPALPSASPGPEEAEWLVHPIERESPVREVFQIIGPLLVKVNPVDLDQRGIGRGDRLKGELRDALDRFSKSFGVSAELYQSPREPFAAGVENTDPPAIVLGANTLALGPREQRFLVGAMLGRVKLRTHAACYAVPMEIATLVAEALRCADPSFARFGQRVEAIGRRLQKSFGLFGGEKRALEALLPKFAGPVDFGAFTRAMAFSSHRHGLVACGDPVAAVRALTRDVGQPQPPLTERPEVRELLAFVASEEHLAVRRKMGVALT